MNITLKNVKFSEFASQETNCFEAAVYIFRKGIAMTRKQTIIANVLAWLAIAIVTFVFVNESLNILAN